MKVKTLSLDLGVDLAGLSRSLSYAASRIAAMGEKVEPVRLGVNPAGLAELTDGITRSGEMLAARLSGALGAGGAGRGLADLARVADRTAGTIITGFRRIDNEISFPKVQATLKSVSDSLVKVSAVGVFKGAGGEASAAFGKAGAALGRLWEAGPVARYWRDFETRGAAALAKVRAREAMPARTTVGVGRAIELPGSRVSKGEEKLAANFERLKVTVGGVKLAFLGWKLAADVAGIAAKAAFTIAADYARVATTPVTLLAGLYIKLKAAIARIELPLTRIRDVASKGFSAIFGGANQSAAAMTKGSVAARAMGASVRAVNAPVTSLTAGFKGLAVQVAAAFGFFGLIYKTVTFIKDGVVAASDLNESVAATEQVFGKSYGRVEAVVNNISTQFGILRKDQLDAASGFGSIVKGAKGTEQQAADLGITFTQLAADFASFRNLSFADAATKLRAGLAGESEPLRAYGALITATAVEAKALEMGLGTVVTKGGKSKTTFSELAKVQARAALIMDKLKDAQGDLNRTSDSAANQFRKAGGGVAEFGTRIGQLLLPAVKAGTVAFNEVLGSVLEFVEFATPTVTGWVESVAAGFAFVGQVVRNSGAYWEIAKLKVYEFAVNVGLTLATVPENLARIGTWIGTNWVNLLSDAFNAAFAVAMNFGTNLGNLFVAIREQISNPMGSFKFEWTPLLDGFKAATEALPEMVKPALYSVQGEIDKIMADVTAKEAARAASLVKPMQAAAAGASTEAAAAEATTKAPEVKLASAVEVGSKEAYSAVAKAQVGGRESGTKALEKKADTTNGLLTKIERKLGEGGQTPAVFPLGAA